MLPPAPLERNPVHQHAWHSYTFKTEAAGCKEEVQANKSTFTYLRMKYLISTVPKKLPF